MTTAVTLTQDRDVVSTARIKRKANDGAWWVAVDQKGPINTLRNPLARPVRADDPDGLADWVARAWFRADDGPGFHCFAWADEPTTLGLARTIERVRTEQAELFALLGDSVDDQRTVQRICDRFGLAAEDVIELLNQPVRQILPAS